MIVFNADLDNTIIYSYKRDIGQHKKCVELYEGREVSYITRKTEELLSIIKEKCLFIPTTTRTIEQYNRIQLGMGVPEYALTCNGGVLLQNGEFQEDWYQESLTLIRNCNDELKQAALYLEHDKNRSLDVRNIQNLFIFTKSNQPEETVAGLRNYLDTSILDVFNNGVKIYAVPKQLSKGMAIKRLREKLKPEYIIAAGDSEFDISMLEAADMGISHPELFKVVQFHGNVITTSEKTVFSDELLEHIKNLLLEIHEKKW